jgi:PiT family inorganic phosphate transporter
MLDRKPSRATILLFLLLLALGVGYTGYSLVSDVHSAMPHGLAIRSFFLLAVALLIALGFEFVNGFHDTANAVATVIHTHSLAPHFAVAKFIPLWVKVAVAIALGLGTMVGWKRIVVTIGERIGKTHLTYAQGACAELVAMSTIAAADMFGLPVSTTHVLSAGVAGTMAANRSGLQLATLRNLLMAWVLTLPAAIMLSGVLYWSFRQLF